MTTFNPADFGLPGTKRTKYGNVKVEVDGHRFDSAKEADRYIILKLMERDGVISNLRLQVEYPLTCGGSRVSAYVADFVYTRAGAEIVEDVKGFKTRLYKLKRKMMKAEYGVTILET